MTKPQSYEVAIPSYRRPEALVTKTLTMLLNGGVPPNKITIFTHEHDPHHQHYADIAQQTGVNHTATTANGIIQQRRYISDHHYKPGTNIVSLDDDVKQLKQLSADGKKLEPLKNLDAFFMKMFHHTKKEGLTAWGLAPVPNPFFMKPTITTDLKFLIYTCVGIICDPAHRAGENTVATKDDYEHSIRRWYWDGGVIRNNAVVADAAIYTGDGGLQGAPEREHTATEHAIQQLEKQWPGIIRRNNKRKSGLPEIILNPRKRHAGHSMETLPPGDYVPPLHMQ